MSLKEFDKSSKPIVDFDEALLLLDDPLCASHVCIFLLTLKCGKIKVPSSEQRTEENEIILCNEEGESTSMVLD